MKGVVITMSPEDGNNSCLDVTTHEPRVRLGETFGGDMLKKGEYFIHEYFMNGRQCSITEDEFTRTLSSRQTLVAAAEAEGNFTLVARAYIELEKSLMEAVLEWNLEVHNNEQDHHYFTKWRDISNLKLLNFLVMARAYTERIEHIADGKIIPKFTRGDCDKLTRKAHGSSSHYRFMYALRNYSLHRQLPIDGFSIASGREVRPEMANQGVAWRTRLICNPHIRLAPLLNDPEIRDKKIGEEIRNLIDAGKTGIDIKMFARGHMEALYQIHAAVRARSENHIVSAIDCLQETVAQLQKVTEATPRNPHMSRHDDETPHYQIDPDHFIKHMKSRQNWIKLANLRHIYVSSATNRRANMELGETGDIWL